MSLDSYSNLIQKYSQQREQEIKFYQDKYATVLSAYSATKADAKVDIDADASDNDDDKVDGNVDNNTDKNKSEIKLGGQVITKSKLSGSGVNPTNNSIKQDLKATYTFDLSKTKVKQIIILLPQE